jgi:hypothetical protein
MADKNVCSSSINGKTSETFNFKNENGNQVIVKQDGANTWPFTSGPDLTVPAKSGNNAGLLSVTLINATGTYYYKTSGCPGLAEDVNPKTVIIS